MCAVAGFFAWFVIDERIERSRMAAERMTLRYGVLMVGFASGYAPYGIESDDFNLAIISELAARLGLRPAFFVASGDRIFADLDSGIYDIIMPSVPLTPERQAAHKFSKPHIGNAAGDLFAIAAQKGNDRLRAAINGALADMFNDGTMLKISMDAFGIDLVTLAREQW